jgi:hypothetical protein
LSVPAAAWAADTLFTVAEPGLTHVVGAARDPGNGLYWLVQPSEAVPEADYDDDLDGDGIRDDDWVEPEVRSVVVGVDAAGQTQARIRFKHATPNAAALAYYGDSLYVADIADPNLDRETVAVYGMPAGTVAGDQEVPYTGFELEYPDGPHDAAALLVHPSDGHLEIVTLDGQRYSAPVELSAVNPTTLRLEGPAPAGVVDGLYLSDNLVALRTATQVMTVDAGTWAVQEEDPLDLAGESLTLNLEGTGLVAVGLGEAPVAQAVAVPAPETVSTQAAAPSAGDVTKQVSRSGTLLMVVAAGALAVIAGILAFLRR